MARRTALIVEDDTTCSDLLEMVLAGIPDLSIQTVTSAWQARKRLASPQPYSIIITDFHLAGEDGLSLIEAIRTIPGRETLPFVMVTSSEDSEVRRRAERLGARGFFHKPFSPAQLREAVNSILDGL
jgi:CheY-like chemotaxis protein